MDNETKENKKGSFLINTVKGVTLGVSVAVPGLSAGTIAIAERCYDTLIGSITSLRKEFKKSFLTLLPYILGLLVGALAALIGIKKGYDAAPFSLTALFAGCIVGSLPVALSELKKGADAKEKLRHILAFVLCLAVAAGLGILTVVLNISLESHLVNREWWMYLYVILCGFVAAAACIVPGISGSMSLMVLGMYMPILNTYIGETAIWHGDTMFMVTGLVIALLLVIGALLGLFASSKAMKVLLDKHRVTSFYGILGLILGSLVSMFINNNIWEKYTAGIQTWDFIVGAVLFVLAGVGVFFLVKFANRKDEKPAD